jgi:hypothetical protein
MVAVFSVVGLSASHATTIIAALSVSRSAKSIAASRNLAAA